MAVDASEGVGRSGREPGPVVPRRVSIVIPAYNCAATIAAAVESCLAQAYEDLEIVVVNDGSTDSTGEVLAGFGERIRVLTQRNGGLAAARNAGQLAATGEFVAWMDADDLMVPGRIRAQAAVLTSHPAIGLVSSDFSAFTDAGADFAASHIASYYHAIPRLGGVEAVYPTVLAPIAGLEETRVLSGNAYDSLVWGNFVHPPTVMARRSVLEAAGLADESLRYSSDYDLILRIARRAPLAFVDAPLLRYRLSSGQMSNAGGSEKMQLETVRILRKLQREDPDAHARLAPLIRLRLAESHVVAAGSLGASDRARALGLLVHGMRQKVLMGPAMLALGRIVASPALIQSVKQGLRAVGIRWAVLGWAVFGPDSLEALLLGVDLL